MFATAELSLAQIGVLFGLYPCVWGIRQLITGTASDWFGPKPFITTGMATQVLGYAVGALLGGIVTDLVGLHAAVWAAAAVSAASTLVVAVCLYETHPLVRALIPA